MADIQPLSAEIGEGKKKKEERKKKERKKKPQGKI